MNILLIFLEQTAIITELTTVTSKPDISESVISASVISNLASGERDIHEKQSTEEENTDENLGCCLSSWADWLQLEELM